MTTLATPMRWTRYEVGHCSHPECVVRRGGRWATRQFPSLAFRLRHPRFGELLFDTGYSARFMAATQTFPERLYRIVTPVRLHDAECLHAQLATEGIATRDIRGIVLSHLHGDHVGGVLDFPDAPLWCARAAHHDLRARGRLSALRIGLLPALLGDGFAARCSWIEACPQRPLPDALRSFGEGHDLLGDGSLLAVWLPGHAAGHFGVVFDDGDGMVFLIGDAAWSSAALRDRAPPPSLTTAWLGRTDIYRATFERLCDLVRDEPNVRVVPSHCSEWSPQAAEQRVDAR